MDGAATWYGRVNEDGGFSILARVTALDATGTEVVPSEGPCLKQVDVASITCRVYSLGANKDNASGTQITPAPTLTPAANLFDTLRTSGWPTDKDSSGYNFRHDVAASFVPNQDEWTLLEYKLTLSAGLGSGVVWVRVKVKTRALQTS